MKINYNRVMVYTYSPYFVKNKVLVMFFVHIILDFVPEELVQDLYHSLMHVYPHFYSQSKTIVKQIIQFHSYLYFSIKSSGIYEHPRMISFKYNLAKDFCVNLT